MADSIWKKRTKLAEDLTKTTEVIGADGSRIKKYQTVDPGEQNLFNNGFTLEIEHVPTGLEVAFSAFVDSFSDAYNSEWSAEQVYGRMDPIPTYQNTRRALALSWIVPAASIEQAKSNMDEINKLLTFLYPLYSDPINVAGIGVDAGSTIIQGPLVRVKFGNLIQDAATGGGLLGYLNGFTMDPLLDNGMFMIGNTAATEQKPLRTPSAEYLPKAVKLNFELNVLHEHSLGWVKHAGKYMFRGGKKGFPYATDDWKGYVSPNAPVVSTKEESESDRDNAVVNATNATILE